MNKNFTTFSKIIIVISFFIHIIMLLTGFILLLNGYDTTYILGSSGITGTVLLTSIIFYYKKAQAENIIKNRIGFINASADVQIKIYKEILKLKKKYELTDEELDFIKQQISTANFTEEAISSANEKLDSLQEESEANIELQGGISNEY